MVTLFLYFTKLTKLPEQHTTKSVGASMDPHEHAHVASAVVDLLAWLESRYRLQGLSCLGCPVSGLLKIT